MLEEDGANLPEALNELGKHFPGHLKAVADAFMDVIPRAIELRAEPSLKASPVILLRERGYTDPFTHVDMSDGMLRLLALLYLAHHPTPPPLVCIEEPENGLYPRLIEAMLDALRALAKRTQVMLTTHSVTLLNRLEPHEVIFISRDEAGSHLTRLDSREDVKKFVTRFGIGDQIRMGNVEG